MDTKLTKSTAFHSQTEHQTEVVNILIVHMLSMYNSKHLRTWDENLPYIQHNYNKVIQSSTHHSPFHVCFGFQLSRSNPLFMQNKKQKRQLDLQRDFTPFNNESMTFLSKQILNTSIDMTNIRFLTFFGLGTKFGCKCRRKD